MQKGKGTNTHKTSEWKSLNKRGNFINVGVEERMILNMVLME
jgi:hypothetical protein